MSAVIPTVTKSGTGMWGQGRWDACLGREAWDVGMHVWGDMRHGDAGTWGREIGDVASSRLGTQDRRPGEVRNKRNHFLLQMNQRDRLSTGRPTSVCVVCLWLELEN